MAASQIVIFYATGSKQIRGVLVPDSDAELAALLKGGLRAGDGETMLTAPAFVSAQRGVLDPANLQHVIDQVTKATGVAPSDPACAVVNDQGLVEAIIAADDAIDTIPGKALVQAYSPEIVAGVSYDAGSRLFTVPEKIIPASVDRFTGQAVAQRTIPAKTLSRTVQADGAILQA